MNKNELVEKLKDLKEVYERCMKMHMRDAEELTYKDWDLASSHIYKIVIIDLEELIAKSK